MISPIVYKRSLATVNIFVPVFYMPSVTTVLSATETEKSKAGLRTWQKNNPGALEGGKHTWLRYPPMLRELSPWIRPWMSRAISTVLEWDVSVS